MRRETKQKKDESDTKNAADHAINSGTLPPVVLLLQQRQSSAIVVLTAGVRFPYTVQLYYRVAPQQGMVLYFVLAH